MVKITHIEKDKIIEKLKQEVIATETKFVTENNELRKQLQDALNKNGKLVDIATKLETELSATTTLLKLKL